MSTKWPHLFEYDFPSSANDGLVDLVRWVDNANLHYSFVDVCEKEGIPVTHLGLLWWANVLGL